jgi:outer membrane protein assembly factor BamB
MKLRKPLALLLPLLVLCSSATAQSPLSNQANQIPRLINDTANRVLRGTLDVPSRIPGGTTALSLSADGRLLAARLANGEVRVWQLDAGTEVGFWPDAGQAVGELALLGDAAGTLAALAADGTVRLWQPGTTVRTIPTPTPVIAMAADNGRVAMADADGIRLLNQGETSPHPLANLPGITALAWAGSQLVAATANGRLHALDAGDGTERAISQLDRAVARLLGSGDAVVAMGTDGTLSRWQPGSGERPRRLERVRGQPAALAVDPTQGLLVIATERQVRALDLTTGRQRWSISLTQPASALALHPSGRLLLAGADGISAWNGSGGRRVLRLIPARDGWLAVDEAGRYDGTGVTTWQAGWQTQLGRLPMTGLQASNYEPELLSKSFQPAPTMLTPVPAPVEQGIEAPPTVQMEFSATPPALLPATLEVRVTARERSGGLDSIQLWQNGKVVPAEARADSRRTGNPGATSLVEIWRIPAQPGMNRIVAAGIGRGDRAGPGAELTASLTSSGTRPQLHILAIGVDDVEAMTQHDPDSRLLYAVADADSMADHLTRGGTPLYHAVETRLLRSRTEVTQAAILAALEKLRTTKPEDVVVIFMAGHGQSIGEHWYFLPGDMPLSPERGQTHFLLDSHAISTRRLIQAIQAIPAGRILLAIDSCQSGKVTSTLNRGLELRAMASIGQEAGVHVLAATRPNEYAVEFESLGHGAFTLALLSGLAQAGPQGGAAVRAMPLLAFAEREAPTISRQGALKQAAQLRETLGPQAEEVRNLENYQPGKPTLFTIGADFPLVLPVQ